MVASDSYLLAKYVSLSLFNHTLINQVVSFPDRFFPFLFVVAEKGLVDLRRTFCATDSHILGVVNWC